MDIYTKLNFITNNSGLIPVDEFLVLLKEDSKISPESFDKLDTSQFPYNNGYIGHSDAEDFIADIEWLEDFRIKNKENKKLL